jgi:hypothetical protein
MRQELPRPDYMLLGNSIGAGIDLDAFVLFSKTAKIKM